MGLRGPRSATERAALNAKLNHRKDADVRPLDERQLAYIEWLVCPRPERNPPTQQEFAAQLGVTPQSLAKWRQHPSFKATWDARVDQLAGSPERAQAVYDAIFQRAVEGDVRAAELFLKASGRLQPPTVTVTTSNPAADLSDDELESLIVQAAKAEHGRRLKVVND
jgi:hypothetical protein